MADVGSESSQKAPDITESQREISVWEQSMIDSDPRLTKLAGESIENRQIILYTLNKNESIFKGSDNSIEKQRLLSESLKDYGKIASNGQKFEDLEKLSTEEMGKLPFAIRIELKKWQKNKLDQTIVSNNEEGKQLDITKESKEKNETQIIEIKKISQNENNGLKEIQEKLPKIKEIYNPLFEKLSSNDKQLLSTSLSTAKGPNSDNAAVEELKKQGVIQTEIQSGKYDSYISASIIIENASKFEAYQKDPEAFKKSINALQSLGIPVRVQSDFQSVSSHIGERFAKGERTDTALASIRGDLASGQYRGIHYDGIGEKYTLIGNAENVRKDIYMDKPPRAKIRLNGLTIEREVPTMTQEEKKRINIQERYSKNLMETSQVKITTSIANTESEQTHSDALYKKAIDRNTPIKDRIASINELQNINKKRKEENLKSMLEKNTNPEPRNSELEAEGRSLDTLSKFYQEELSILKEANTLPIPVVDSFDIDAENALKALNEYGYDELGDDNLRQLIEGFQKRDGYNGIWESGKIDMTDSFNREKQLLELRNFPETIQKQLGGNTSGEILQNLRIKIQKDEATRKKISASEGIVEKST